MNEPSPHSFPDPVRPERGFWSKLANGEFGLAKTYWIYNVVVGIAVNLIANEITSLSSLAMLMLIYTPYQATVLLGVWRAAGAYSGPKIWAVLARAAGMLGATMLVLSVLGLLTMIGSGGEF